MMSKNRKPCSDSEENDNLHKKASDKRPYDHIDLSTQSHLTTLKGKSREIIFNAKVGARPELQKYNAWMLNNYHKDFEKRWPINDKTVANNIEYVDMDKISTNDFEKHYVRNKIPCVMLNSQNKWQATKKWNFHRLSKKYRNQSLKCGEDDDGNNVKMKMKYYLEYAQTTLDDSPLYIFDANYGEHRKNKQLLEDYEVPDVFKDDIFEYVSAHRRPPHRWFVMGPPRSGTGIHIDPLGTSAWNALVVGHKRWFLLPTHVNGELIKPTSKELEHNRHQRDEAITWFEIKRPKVLEMLKEKYPDVKPIEVIQKPGETMFVPSGWWHTVLNLDNTIAVTQNFAHREHFGVCYHKSVRARPKMTEKLVEQLKLKRPDVMKIIRSVDLTKPSGQASSSSSGSDSSTSSSSSGSDSDDNSDSMTDVKNNNNKNKQNEKNSDSKQKNENLERNRKLLELRISEKRSNLKEKISGLINHGTTPGSMTARKKMRN